MAKYEAGASIGGHVDAEVLGKYVSDLNLLCAVAMHFMHIKGGHHFVQWLDPGSLVTMRGEARWAYTHAVPKTKIDERNAIYSNRTLRFVLLVPFFLLLIRIVRCCTDTVTVTVIATIISVAVTVTVFGRLAG